MKVIYCLAIALLANSALIGCNNPPNEAKKPQSKAKEDEIETALAKLSPEDRKLAEAQKFCAIQNKGRLGSMGTPIKVMVKDVPVFLCCDHCKDEVKKDPDAAVKKANDLKAANK